MAGMKLFSATWWDKHFRAHPDLAFILPRRYDTEKGYPDISEAKRTQTKGLIFAPAYPSPGDTVSILTRIHNYSLKNLNEAISVQCYPGDPDNGGELTNVIYNVITTSEIVLAASLAAKEDDPY